MQPLHRSESRRLVTESDLVQSESASNTAGRTRRRRNILLALSLGPALPAWAQSQPAAKLYRIGLLLPNTPEIAARNPRTNAFLQGLRELGLVEGRNVVIERRFAGQQLDRLNDLALELAALRVDVIVTATAPSALAARRATATIPIVMLDPGDPVGLGLVPSLARPGGNVTGVTSIAPELASKRLALLKETVPATSRVAVLFNAGVPPAELAMRETQAAAKTLGVQIQAVEIRGAEGLDEAFRNVVQFQANGLIVFPDPLTFSNQDSIVNFARINRIPALYGAHEFADAGGLISYGPNYQSMFRRGAYYVDRILKGAKAEDLPIEQPTTFDMVLNMKTAKALGITLPQSIQVQVNRVVE